MSMEKEQKNDIYEVLQNPQHNDISKFSFSPRTIITWNNLPFIELPANINAFKSAALTALRASV